MNAENKRSNQNETPADHMSDFHEFADKQEAAMLRELDGLPAEEPQTRTESGTRPKSKLGRRVAVGVALTAAALSPPGQAAIDAFEDRIDQDRVFNPDRGNPENTDEIVSSWNEDPAKTTIVVEAPDTAPDVVGVQVDSAEATDSNPEESGSK